jgi:predicted Zn-dependent protease
MMGPDAADRAARTEWEGAYLDGQTPARQRVTIRLMPSGLEVLTEHGTRFFWPYPEIRQTQGFYAGEPVRLEHGGTLGQALVVASPAFLAALHAVAPAAGGRFHHPARRRRRGALTLLAVIAVVAIVAGLHRWGIPAVADLVAMRVPVSWETRLGEAVLDELAPPERRCGTPGGTAALDGLVTSLTRPLGALPQSFRVHVLDAPQINAFALPGGHVVLLRGLVEGVGTPDELAGVLAHELQHVLHRHALRAVLRHASTGLLVVALAGDPTGALAYGLEAARTLGALRQSRAAEEEADLGAARMLVAAGLDPLALVSFLERLGGEGSAPEGVLAYLSTHPSHAGRIARLRRLAAEAPSTPARPVEAEAWHAIRTICHA